MPCCRLNLSYVSLPNKRIRNCRKNYSKKQWCARIAWRNALFMGRKSIANILFCRCRPPPQQQPKWLITARRRACCALTCIVYRNSNHMDVSSHRQKPSYKIVLFCVANVGLPRRARNDSDIRMNETAEMLIVPSMRRYLFLLISFHMRQMYWTSVWHWIDDPQINGKKQKSLEKNWSMNYIQCTHGSHALLVRFR